MMCTLVPSKSDVRSNSGRLPAIAYLVHLVGLYGVVGYHIEGLKVQSAGREHDSPGLTAERSDAAADQLQQDVLVLVFQPSRIELLVQFVSLPKTSSQLWSSELSRPGTILDLELENSWL